MKLLNKILVANRGEIAVRIIRTLRKMGISPVAVYSATDSDSLHVSMADEAYELEGNGLQETYLSIPKIIQIASQSGCDGIHPGYGFLSENEDFAFAAANAGINFIGPTPEIIQLMGNKISAREILREIEVPMLKGIKGTKEMILKNSDEMNYPLIIKAALGGGGKGMHIVWNPSDLAGILELSHREALSYFADGTLYAEHYLPEARHIEVQVLADHYGNIILLGDRECSVQRRYQKFIEEAPAVSISESTRLKINSVALAIIKRTGYNNAGTLEFLVDKDGNPYFMEMNTRIQVEHPVTEMVTGIDIIEQQILIAAGNEIGISQNDVNISNHAIEARIYAESPENDFLPSPGKIVLYREPKMPGLRIDTGISKNTIIDPQYDSLLAKVIFLASDRTQAINGLSKALNELIIPGPETNREFIGEILRDSFFVNNNITNSYVESSGEKLRKSLKIKKAAYPDIWIIASWLCWKLNERNYAPPGLWNEIGSWRLSAAKSVMFRNKKFDIFISRYSGSDIWFSLENKEYHVSLKSNDGNHIVFEFDNCWLSASVAALNPMEDIVVTGGFEFKVKPLDYLPEQPFISEDRRNRLNGTRIMKSPLHGKIINIIDEPGKIIKKGDVLYSLDAMKIENKITSQYDGCLREVKVMAGDQVLFDQTIMIIDEFEINNE